MPTPKLAKIHEPWVRWNAKPGTFGHGGMDPVRVVLHDTESHDAPGVTEIIGVANFWMQTPLGDRLGAHYIVDGDGNIGQCGQPDEVLYHVGGLNTGSIGIEQIGMASFTEEDWLRRPEQLLSVAKLLAWLHTSERIPLVIPAQQGAGLPMHGVMTHGMVSRFEPASGGHTDPGSGYPIGKVLKMANGFVKAGGWPKEGAMPDAGKKPGAGGGGLPGGATGKKNAKKVITVRGGPNLEVIGHTAGVKRYVLNPRHAATIRRARPHLHFDTDKGDK